MFSGVILNMGSYIAAASLPDGPTLQFVVRWAGAFSGTDGTYTECPGSALRGCFVLQVENQGGSGSEAGGNRKGMGSAGGLGGIWGSSAGSGLLWGRADGKGFRAVV